MMRFTRQKNLRHSCAFPLLSALISLSAITQCLAGPIGVVGDIYIANQHGFTITEHRPDPGNYYGFLIGDFTNDSPTGAVDLTFGPNGDLFVAYYDPDQVIQYDGNTGGFIRTLTNFGLADPAGLRFLPNGHLLVANSNGFITEYDGDTGEYLGVWAVVPDIAYLPLNIREDGHVFVSQDTKNRVIEFDADGTNLGTFASGGGLTDIGQNIFGPNGNLFVAGASGENIVEFDGKTGEFVRSINLNGFDPSGIAFSDDGQLLITSDTIQNEFFELNSETGELLNSFNNVYAPMGITLKPTPAPRNNYLTVLPAPLKLRRTANFTITGALPDTPTFLLYSITGIGSGRFIHGLNVIVDLDQPRLAFEPQNTDESGNVSWESTIPLTRPLPDIWFQAAQPNNVTNFVPTRIDTGRPNLYWINNQ